MADETSPDQAEATDPEDELRDEDEFGPIPADETPTERTERRKREAVTLDNMRRRQKALKARIAGMTWRDVAKTAGYGGPGSAYRAVQEELAKIPRPAAKELLQVELATLDELQTFQWKNARQGDSFAAGRILAIMDQRAKYLQLYKGAEEDTAPQSSAVLLGFLDKTREVVSELDELRRKLEANGIDVDKLVNPPVVPPPTPTPEAGAA